MDPLPNMACTSVDTMFFPAGPMKGCRQVSLLVSGTPESECTIGAWADPESEFYSNVLLVNDDGDAALAEDNRVPFTFEYSWCDRRLRDLGEGHDSTHRRAGPWSLHEDGAERLGFPRDFNF
ncbi:MAG: hypothetical protein AB8H86_03310 [Polyangiales bacterium]